MAASWKWKHGASLSLDDLTRNRKKLGNEELREACWTGNEAVCIRLLQSSPGIVDVNEKDNFDDTPLHHAASVSASIVKVLLDVGAQPNYRNKLKVTPLHRSCAEGNLEAAKLLVAAGAAVNAADDFMNTPLHHACARGRCSTADFMLDNGGLLECKNMRGHTPLLVALVEGHWDVVRMLVERGANKRTVDAKGKTGYCLVRENRKMAVELQHRLLTELGGVTSSPSSLSVSLRGSRGRSGVSGSIGGAARWGFGDELMKKEALASWNEAGTDKDSSNDGSRSSSGSSSGISDSSKKTQDTMTAVSDGRAGGAAGRGRAAYASLVLDNTQFLAPIAGTRTMVA